MTSLYCSLYYVVGYIAPDIIRSDTNGSYDWNVDMFSVSEQRERGCWIDCSPDDYHWYIYHSINDYRLLSFKYQCILPSLILLSSSLILLPSIHHYHHHSSLLPFRSELWLMLCSVGMNPSTAIQRLNWWSPTELSTMLSTALSGITSVTMLKTSSRSASIKGECMCMLDGWV